MLKESYRAVASRRSTTLAEGWQMCGMYATHPPLLPCGIHYKSTMTLFATESKKSFPICAPRSIANQLGLILGIKSIYSRARTE